MGLIKFYNEHLIHHYFSLYQLYADYNFSYFEVSAGFLVHIFLSLLSIKFKSLGSRFAVLNFVNNTIQPTTSFSVGHCCSANFAHC